MIDLAAGNDTVQIGSPQETLNLGSGNDTVIVASATIGNGTGTNTLEVTGGGTMAMSSSISDIATVLLVGAATPYNFTANALGGLTVDDLDTGLDTLQAGGTNQTLTGGDAGKLTMAGSSTGRMRRRGRLRAE